MSGHEAPPLASRTNCASHRGRFRFVYAALLALAALAAPAGARAEANSAAMVLDAGSGQILYGYNPDAPHRPASLTKMMTLYMAFEAMRDGRLRPRQQLAVSRRAANQRPSRLGLSRGRMIAVEDAVLALITKSANDAAVVIAESVAGTETEFAARMTARAHELGMTRTRFRNASGLHDRDQWTTARDMATLALALIRDFPEQYRYFATASFSWRGRRYQNHNALLSSYEGADGIKTGYIRQSGFNLVASAERDGRRLVGIVLGGETSDLRDWRMTRMFDYGFALPQDRDEAAAAAPPLPYGSAEADEETLVALLGRKEIRLAAVQASPPDPQAEADSPAEAGSAMPERNDVWSIQVGAYGTAAPAEEAAARAADRIPELTARAKLAVIPFDRDGTRLYRARLVGLTEDKAREACRQLARQRIPCLAVTTASTALALNVSR